MEFCQKKITSIKCGGIVIMRSFESIIDQQIEEEEHMLDEDDFHFGDNEILVDRVYYMNGYEAWKVIQLGQTNGTDGVVKFFVTMIRLSDCQLRTILQSTFRKKWKLDIRSLRTRLKHELKIWFVPADTVDKMNEYTKTGINDKKLTPYLLGDDIAYELYKLRADFHSNEIWYTDKILIFIKKEFCEIYQAGGGEALVEYARMKDFIGGWDGQL